MVDNNNTTFHIQLEICFVVSYNGGYKKLVRYLGVVIFKKGLCSSYKNN
jgi:hypothetical protein